MPALQFAVALLLSDVEVIANCWSATAFKATPPNPDLPFHNFGDSTSGDLQILCSSGTSCDIFLKLQICERIGRDASVIPHNKTEGVGGGGGEWGWLQTKKIRPGVLVEPFAIFEPQDPLIYVS